MSDQTNMDQQGNSGAAISDHTTSSTTSDQASSSATRLYPEEPAKPEAPQSTRAEVEQKQDTMQVLADDQDKPKRSSRKMIATIFGVLFLIGGVAAGVFLVQRQQNIQERASSGAACDQADDCVLFDEPGNAGTQAVGRTIEYLDITNKPGEERRYTPGISDDGCYRVSIQGVEFTWQRVGEGPQCKDVSNIQVWMSKRETPTISASCSEIKAYDRSWNPLSTSQLQGLDSGETIYLTVEGMTDDGIIDKARFRINSSEWQESTNLKPGEARTYYINYTIPEDTNNFTINAQVHLSDNDTWY